MREIVHIQAGQCGNQIGAKVGTIFFNSLSLLFLSVSYSPKAKIFPVATFKILVVKF
jgi:hypothetical protein